ncbi:outer membrane protein assembly factor BamB family protein [Hymenobacter psychrotolerans]|uniref:PQQ-like domain-containing protein n=1 Tax=Hymenobacter psychrotolerans DSM 18569 TaxID=1121959 RepID=A0A1M7DP29_9BACT|nr:PQQ-binding-like beta-propeller repeat protein [Hymenobacter psychrotolerans]SHL81158.1 PQQ-like domain-containing protein [Hymenobacter psychrotolerans DSM 18569]
MIRMLPLRRMALLSLLALATACSKHDETPATPATPELATFEKTVPLPASYRSPSDVAELTDGSLFVLATAEISVSPLVDRPVGIKLTAAGDTLWTRRYLFGTAPHYGVGYQCLPTSDGNVVFTAKTLLSANIYEPRLTKLNAATGAVLWTLAFPDRIFVSTCRVASTADGGFLLVDNENDQSFRLHTITAAGTLASTTTLPYGLVSDIRPTTDGNFIIASVQNAASQPQPVLTKLTAQGSVLWSRPTAATGFGATVSVAQTPDGGYALASGISYTNSLNPLRLLKTDANGQQQFVRSYPATEGFSTRLGLNAGKLVLAGALTTSSGTLTKMHPLVLRLDAATGAEELRQARPQVAYGSVASFTTTRDGKLLLCSSEEGKLVLRKTNPDLTN